VAKESFVLDRILLPVRPRHPFKSILWRVAFAWALLCFIAVVVYVGRDGYVDSAGGDIGAIDALYYASVTVTTTGYGDITAISDGARLATVVLITPARILFLILVVGTTVEVLTDQSRQLILTRRWRQRVNDHFVICGFGSTGRSAAAELVALLGGESGVHGDRDEPAGSGRRKEPQVVGSVRHRDGQPVAGFEPFGSEPCRHPQRLFGDRGHPCLGAVVAADRRIRTGEEIEHRGHRRECRAPRRPA